MDPRPLPDRIPHPEGARFGLRRLRSADLPAMVGYRSEPDVARYQSWTPDWNEADARRLHEADRRTTHVSAGEWIQLVIEELTGRAVCGDVGVHFVADQPDTVEIGVTLAPAYQGRGIATASLTALLVWLFDDLDIHRVFAHADERNVAVRNLLDRLGFRQEATFVDADWFKGEWTTLCVYSMLHHEWNVFPRRWPGRSRMSPKHRGTH
jgi:RimJ/RimL family protein N-acetyltransferase